MASRYWTDDEQICLLASVDICIEQDTKLQDGLIQFMNGENYRRTWAGIQSQLSRLCDKYTPKGEKKIAWTAVRFRTNGSACLKLPIGLRDSVTAARRRIESRSQADSNQSEDIPADAEAENSKTEKKHRTAKKRPATIGETEKLPNKRTRIGEPTKPDNEKTDQNRLKPIKEGFDRSHPISIPSETDSEDESTTQSDLTRSLAPKGDKLRHEEPQRATEETAQTAVCEKHQAVEKTANEPTQCLQDDSQKEGMLNQVKRKELKEQDNIATEDHTSVATKLRQRVQELEDQMEMKDKEHAAEHSKILRDVAEKENTLETRFRQSQKYQEERLKAVKQTFLDKSILLEKEMVAAKKQVEELKKLHLLKMESVERKTMEVEELLHKEIEMLKRHAVEAEGLHRREVEALEQALENQKNTHKEEERILENEFVAEKKLAQDEVESWRQWKVRQDELWRKVTGKYHLFRLGSSWPAEFNATGLKGHWENTHNHMWTITIKAKRLEGFPTFPLPNLSERFSGLLHRICGLEVLAGSQSPDFSKFYEKISSVKPELCLLKALIGAEAYEWCFTTSFHTKGLESQKLDQLWEMLAQAGGIKQMQNYDRLSIGQRANDPYFKDHTIPEIAKAQARRIAAKFAGLLPMESDDVLVRLVEMIKQLMYLKLDLQAGLEKHRICYIPPGTPFDPNHMIGLDENEIDLQINKLNASRYRTTLCQWPLLAITDEPELAENLTIGDNYKDYLIENRKFFPEKAGQFKDWVEPRPYTLSKAIVFVEKILDDAGNDPGVPAGKNDNIQGESKMVSMEHDKHDIINDSSDLYDL